MPRALWRDRLLRLKRGGYNAVEFYTFWNYHEPKEGQINFTGDHDLNAFLKLVKQMGLYAIARVGPYYCGEWNMGGLPIWLRFKSGLHVREDDPQFLKATDRYFDKLIPIITKNQINNGGAVIMVQLENEHRAAWGTVTPNGYFRHLINKTVALGLAVPYFFSGLHPGNDPAGELNNLDDPKRPNPWFSTEYWGVWFLNYGPQPQDSAIYDRRTWKVIAHGGAGYNVYMAHGGTNFEYNNDQDMAASYDYGASVGQAGDLRPLYYSFKRANWFARSFQQILANSSNIADDKPIIPDTNIKVSLRKGPAGTIAFLDNIDSNAIRFEMVPPIKSKITKSEILKLAAGEILPIISNYQLIPGVKITWAPMRIYSVTPQGKTTTLLLYGSAGTTAQVYFNVSNKLDIISGATNFKITDSLLTFSSTITSSPQEYSFETNGQRIRLIVVNNELAAHSWFTETNGQTNIVIGPEYADEVTINADQLNLITEQPWTDKNSFPTWIFRPAGRVIKLNSKTSTAKHISKLKLGPWKIKTASNFALPGYDDRSWLLIKEPLQMGADGDITAEAWYRTKIKVTQTGNYILKFKNIHDRASLFLDGKRADTSEIFYKKISVYLKAGKEHTIALFTAHDGRNKLIFKVGEIDTIDMKGLSGAVTLQNADSSGKIKVIKNWRMKGGPGNATSKTGWKPLSSGKINSPQFYRAVFNYSALNTRTVWRVNTTSLSYGSAWINGHNLGRYPEKIKINGLYIPECWLKIGTNSLIIYDENGFTPGKVAIEAEVEASRDIKYLKIKN